MRLRKWTAGLLIVFMLLTMVSGCKSSSGPEEEAFIGEYVEGTQPGQNTDNDTEQPNDNQTPSDNNQSNDTEQPSDNEEPSNNDQPSNTQKPSDTQNPSGNGGNEQEGGQTNDDNSGGNQEEQPTDPVEPDEEDPLAGTDPANKLKIIAYNIRCANDGEGKDIADRAPRFKMLVDELDADILALSEASVPWIEYLERNIVGSKYKMLYKYRAETSLEAQPLLYDYNKFELLDDGYFWLSETPEVSSIGWGGKHYRGCTWAKLKVKATGKIFLYYCTHLTGSEVASVGSAKLIQKYAAEQGGFSKYPVFVSGDFNIEPWSVGYTEFTTYFNDVNDYLGFDPTYTNGGYTEVGGGNHIIDYVMASPDNIIPTHYEVLHRKYLGGFISDHKGIYVEATLK